MLFLSRYSQSFCDALATRSLQSLIQQLPRYFSLTSLSDSEGVKERQQLVQFGIVTRGQR